MVALGVGALDAAARGADVAAFGFATLAATCGAEGPVLGFAASGSFLFPLGGLPPSAPAAAPDASFRGLTRRSRPDASAAAPDSGASSSSSSSSSSTLMGGIAHWADITGRLRVRRRDMRKDMLLQRKAIRKSLFTKRQSKDSNFAVHGKDVL